MAYDTSKLKSAGKEVFIHENADIIRPELFMAGNHVRIDKDLYITTGADIGSYTHLGPRITVIGGGLSKLIVGDFATISAGTTIVCGTDTFSGKGFTSTTVPEKYRDQTKYGEIIIEKFAGVGDMVTILPGVTIAEGSVVGAGAVVTKNTEPWTYYVGNPARPMKDASGEVKKRPSEKMKKMAKELGY
jgi:acetyltransferase-like isoleucine patch superfamily enzyme